MKMDVLIMGEMLVEIMRVQENVELDTEGVFRGPFPSGAPVIFIDTVARLGHKTAIIGGVGKDDFGRNILDRLEKDGVNCQHVIESEKCATGVAFVTYFDDGSRKFIFHMGNTPAVQAKAPAPNAFPDVKYMHIMGCSLMSNIAFAREILKTMKMLIESGTQISFDPNIRKELFTEEATSQIIQEVFENTSVFLPGHEELLLITNQDTIENAIEVCFAQPKMKIIALKNGSKGSVIYTRTETHKIGTYPVQQVDATGAGDCFDAAFISGLLDGKDIEQVGKMAAAAGAINAAAFGPAEGHITQEAILNMIEKNNLNSNQ
jgi:Sugar kinases, ribokinase family